MRRALGSRILGKQCQIIFIQLLIHFSVVLVPPLALVCTFFIAIFFIFVDNETLSDTPLLLFILVLIFVLVTTIHADKIS